MVRDRFNVGRNPLIKRKYNAEMPYRRISNKIRKAVIPVAGLGTRFLPVTRAVPKALLPVINTPIIHYSVQEAAAAGIRDIVLIMGPGMDSVAGYFTHQAVLEATLRERGQAGLLKEQQRISKMVDLAVILQHDPRGLGHAILLARDFIGNEPFAVFLPDDILWGDTPAISQLMDVRSKYGGSVIAAREVAHDLVSKFGIIEGKRQDDGVYSVSRLVEKPKPEDAPSNLAVVGRYILEPKVFDYLEGACPGAGGEIQLTDAIAKTIGEIPLHACQVKGFHADAGVPAGLLAASLFEARKDPALRQVVMTMVESWRHDSPGT